MLHVLKKGICITDRYFHLYYRRNIIKLDVNLEYDNLNPEKGNLNSPPLSSSYVHKGLQAQYPFFLIWGRPLITPRPQGKRVKEFLLWY